MILLLQVMFSGLDYKKILLRMCVTQYFGKSELLWVILPMKCNESNGAAKINSLRQKANNKTLLCFLCGKMQIFHIWRGKAKHSF